MGTPRRPPEPPRFRRPARGRADLLYCRARHGSEALARSAQLFGYQAPEPPAEQPATGGCDQPSPGTPGAQPPAKREPAKGMRFIRLRERQPVDGAAERVHLDVRDSHGHPRLEMRPWFRPVGWRVRAQGLVGGYRSPLHDTTPLP